MDTETELEVNEKTRHEDKVVHLQMIQGVIDRMSTSAAIYKGFAATIVTGIAAISFTEVSAWIVSKNNAEYREMVEEEFTSLTKLGNDFRIRHHETNKKDICCIEHYDYLFHRCIAVLRLVTSVLRENSLNENG